MVLAIPMKDHSIMAIYEKFNELAQSEPRDSESLALWYEHARELASQLRENPSLCDLVPIRIWQFLSDADIRLKDEVYAAQQRRIVAIFLAGLQEGTILSAEQIDQRIEAYEMTENIANKPTLK